MQFMTLSFFHEGCHITAIQVQVHHPYISFFLREWTYTSHFRLQGQPQFYTISSSPFTMFSGSCLTVLFISDHSPILLYTTDNFSYRHFKFKIFDTDNFRQLYFKSLTILTTDNRIFSYWHFLPLLDACISNHWQYTSYHWHWQLYLLSLTVVLLTTDISITYDCTSYHWEFYHWWLHFLKLTILNNDNCISYHQQLYFLQPTIVPLTITNCNSLPLTILFLALTILITDNCFVLPVM